MTHYERLKSVEACKWVDEIVPNCPWVCTVEFMKERNIDFIAHDAIPYTSGSSDGDVYRGSKEAGMFLPTLRTDGISTSSLIRRIVGDRDDLILRNVQRGDSLNSLNVSHMEYFVIVMKHRFMDLVGCSKKVKNFIREKCGGVKSKIKVGSNKKSV